MIEARKFSALDFLTVAVAFGLLFTFFAQPSRAEVIVVSTARTETKHPLTFAPVTVKVSPQCGCHLEGGCKCVDCKCAAALKNTGAVSVGGTNPTRAAAKPVAAPTYTAASGQWVRSCNGNTCQRVWQPSQPAAATKRAQVPQVQVQRRGLFGRRR
jgi:hypothetical protein